MALKKWKILEGDKSLAAELAEECDIDSFLALLLVKRGITEPYDVEEFLSDIYSPEDPYSLVDMDIAAERVISALEKGERIVIFGDYDCDGVTSTALLYSYLNSKGANVRYYIPDRLTEGYGMNVAAVDKVYAEGVDLIITVDNGINCEEEIAHANELGVDVVVTDHHIPQGNLPSAVAVVDPHRLDDMSYCKNLAGVGVAFKLVCAIDGGEPEELLEKYADLICLGTIGDIVPLLSENRAICKKGLLAINNHPSVGIAALKEASGGSNKPLSVGNVSFQLVPRINAAGRMGSSLRAVELLVSEDFDSALKIAEELDSANRERQRLCEQVYEAASNIIDSKNLAHNNVITVCGEDWHHGIVGIVASKLVERYGKPTIVFSRDGENYRGSGRSVEGFNLFESIAAASTAAEFFGGHELAAGVTVKAEKIDEFCELVCAYAEDVPEFCPTVTLDCKLRPDVIGIELAELLSFMEPYGAGNPAPLFGLYNARIQSVVPLKGGKYIKLNVVRDGYTFGVLCFMYSAENFPFAVGDFIDVAFHLEAGEFAGAKRITLNARQLRPHKVNEDLYFDSLSAYNSLNSANFSSVDAELIYPERDDFKSVFAYLRGVGAPVSAESIIFHVDLPAGKILAALDVFSEMGLISVELQSGYPKYYINQNAEKVNLEDSVLLNKIKQGKAGEQ